MTKSQEGSLGKGKQPAGEHADNESHRITIGAVQDMPFMKGIKTLAGEATPFEARPVKHIAPTSLRKKLFGDILHPPIAHSRLSLGVHPNLNKRAGTPTPLRFESIDSIIPTVKPMLISREHMGRTRNNKYWEEDDQSPDVHEDEEIDNSQNDADYDDNSMKKGKKKAASTRTKATARSTKKKQVGLVEVRENDRQKKIVDAIEQVNDMLLQIDPLTVVQTRKRKANFSELENVLKKLHKEMGHVVTNILAEIEEKSARRFQREKVWKQMMLSIDEQEHEDQEEAGVLLKERQHEVEDAKKRTSTYIQGWYDASKMKKAITEISGVSH